MPGREFDTVPHCREDPPWCACGDPRSSDFGWVFVRPGAGRARRLSFDREGRLHALTLLDERPLGAELVLHGRRFRVASAAPAAERF